MLNFGKLFRNFYKISIQTLILLFISQCAFATSLKIQYSGINKELQEKVSNNLSLNYLLDDDAKNITSDRIELLHEMSSKEITEALNSFGYYDAAVTPSLTADNGNYIARYNISLGKPVIIKQSGIRILKKAYPERLNKLLVAEKLKVGDILLHKNYEDTKEEILAKFIDRGYLNVHFKTHEILIDKDRLQAFINLEIEVGRRYYMGDVTFESETYSNETLQKYVPFEKGEQYTTKKIETLRATLQKTNFFNKVIVKPNPNLKDKSNTTVPILVKLKEKPDNRFYGSIGYLSNLGFRGTAGYMRRHIGDDGQQFSTDASYSKIIKSLYLKHDIPARKPINNKYQLLAGLSDERIRDRLSKKGEIGAQKIYSKKHIKNMLGLKYMHEIYKVKKTDPKSNSSLLMPSFEYYWTRSSKDDFPHGKSVHFAAVGAAQKALSTTDLLKLDLNAKWIMKVTKYMRFILKGGVGSIFAKKFNDVPLSMRYFAGGDNSVRGFGYKSIGPIEKDANGNDVTIGGKYRALLSGELEHRITKDLSAALFCDAGNAMHKWNEPNAVGTGAGIRWRTPLGSLKFDVAKPIARKVTKHLRFHLTFGADF